MTSFTISLENKVDSVTWRTFPRDEWDRSPPVCHSIVEILTDDLFDCVNWSEDIISQPTSPSLGNIDYPTRKVVYGLVENTRDVWNDSTQNVDRFLKIRWAIRGMFYNDIYISKRDNDLINSMEIPAIAVCEVLGPRDSSVPPDEYVDLFFIQTSNGWGMRYVPQGFDEYGMCVCGRRTCARVCEYNVWRMAQMYLDMKMEEEVLDNKQKRFICYKIHTWYVHGPLGFQNRIPLNNCIEVDIKRHFPNLDEEEFVGFLLTEDV